jgi:hypothetical protein
VHHVLKIDNITGLESISETIVQSVEKLVLLLLIYIHVIHGHRTLLQIFKFFLLGLHHSKWHMMGPEVVPEFLPVDGLWLLMGFNICVPPIYNRSN